MLTLREYKAEDARLVVTWFTDREMFEMWNANKYDHYPISAQDMNDFYDAQKSVEGVMTGDNFWAMTALDDDKVVGHLFMHYLDKEKETIKFGCIIVDGNIRGKGYGSKMLELAIDYAFNEKGAKKVTLGVFENNQRAIKCYDRLMFKPEYDEILNGCGKDCRIIHVSKTKAI